MRTYISISLSTLKYAQMRFSILQFDKFADGIHVCRGFCVSDFLRLSNVKKNIRSVLKTPLRKFFLKMIYQREYFTPTFLFALISNQIELLDHSSEFCLSFIYIYNTYQGSRHAGFRD